MKKVFAILSVALALSQLTGCQKTPDKPAAAGKGDSRLEQKILAAATPMASAAATQSGDEPLATPAQLPGNGERIMETLKNKSGTVELTIDAEAKRYENQTFPAAVVVPKKFTQQQAEKIIQALVGDSFFYDPYIEPREELNDQLIWYRERMSKAPEEKKEGYKRIISRIEARLKKAIPKNEIPPASRKFCKTTSTLYSESIVGKFDRDGNTYSLWINNSEDGKLSDAAMHKAGPGVFSIIGRAGPEEAESPVAISYAQALELARQLVGGMQANLSLEDAFIAAAEPEDNPGTGERNYAYQFVFTRDVNGFHTIYDTSCLSLAGTEEENNASNEQPWPYESLVITVDGKGVQDVNWQGPCKVDGILNDNVTMLPFADIMNVFRQMVFVKNSEWETYIEHNEGWARAVVQVDRITLGLMRVQSQGKYYLIPVWDFFGSEDYVMTDGTSLSETKGGAEAQFRSSLNSLLTINAIDGSIIDRCLGY